MPYSVCRLRADSDPVFWSTAMNLDADYVTLYSPADGASHTVINPVTVFVAINVASHRDQAFPFAPGDTIWFYYIWGTQGLSGITSKSPPPTGPQLPSGFTRFSPAFPVILSVDSSGNPKIGHPQGSLIRVRGSEAFYLTAAMREENIPGPGVPSSPRSFDFSDAIPDGVQTVRVMWDAEQSSDAGEVNYAGLITHIEPNKGNGQNLSVYSVAKETAAQTGVEATSQIIPCDDKKVYWSWVLITGPGPLNWITTVFIEGYGF